MKAIAIDDEPVALAILRKFCGQYGHVELETYSSPLLGMRRILEAHPDLVFLDIEMNGADGIGLARSLPAGCCLVFTTAYARYAIDGFEVNAIDFLHKPFFYDRFERAMRKVEDWIRMNRLAARADDPARTLTLKSEYKNVTVRLDDILYIESMNNYVKLFRLDLPPIISQISLKRLLELLPAAEFLRVHRSFVVAIGKVASFTRQQLTLVHAAAEIPVGKIYAEETCRVLAQGRRPSVHTSPQRKAPF